MNNIGTQSNSLYLTPKDRMDLAWYVHMKLLLVMRRNTDIDWLCADISYIREVQRLCREHGSPEMKQWADRLEAMAWSVARESSTLRALGGQHDQPDSEPEPTGFETTWPLDLD